MRALAEYVRSRTAAGSRRATGRPREVLPTIRPEKGGAEGQPSEEVACRQLSAHGGSTVRMGRGA